MTCLDQLVEWAGAGGNNADIDALADRPADHLDLAVVDEFDEFRLSFERDAFDMVDDDAAAVGFDQAPDLAVEGARKGAALVPEQPRSDQAGRYRRAVDHDQRAAGAGRRAVDRAGKDFLAGAGLAFDHHRNARARRLGGDRQRAAEIGRRTDDLFKGERRAQLFGERAQFALRPGGRYDPVERAEQPVGGDRLLHEIARARAHRRDGDLDPVAHRDDDQRQRGAPAAQFGDALGERRARRALKIGRAEG